VLLVDWDCGSGSAVGGGGRLHHSVSDDLLDAVHSSWREIGSSQQSQERRTLLIILIKLGEVNRDVLTVDKLPGLALDMKIEGSVPDNRERSSRSVA
jgi:hypothetical protein